MQGARKNIYENIETYPGYVWKYMEIYGQTRTYQEYVCKYKELQNTCMEL